MGAGAAMVDTGRRVVSIEALRAKLGVAAPTAREETRMEARPRIVWRRQEESEQVPPAIIMD